MPRSSASSWKVPLLAIVEETRSGIAGDENIGPAVVIEIGRDRAHGETVAAFEQPEGLGGLAEGAVAVVLIHVLTRWREAARSAEDGIGLVSASTVCAWLADFCDIEIDVVANEEIEMAVLVVVDERASRNPSGVSFV